MARRTFPKGGAGRSPDQGKNRAGDERRVSCSAVARKGLRWSAVPTGGAVLPLRRFEAVRWKRERKFPGKAGPAVWTTRKGRRAGRPCRRKAKANLRRSAPSRNAEMQTGRGCSTCLNRFTGTGRADNLPGGESQPCRRCLDNRRCKPYDLGWPAAEPRENGGTVDTGRRGLIPEGGARSGNGTDTPTPRYGCGERHRKRC